MYYGQLENRELVHIWELQHREMCVVQGQFPYDKCDCTV